MFSYFQNGITETTPTDNIDFSDLLKLIKNNTQSGLINQIRELKSQGNADYKTLKKKLSVITPNCMVKERSLKDSNFDINFISSSRFVYFDIDNVTDVDNYKNKLIDKFKNEVAMICKSSSGCGLSIFFKITNKIESKEQFNQVWDWIRTTILKDEKIDPQCKDIGRALFISYDPNVYFNYDNEIKMDIDFNSTILNNKPKSVTHPILYCDNYNRLSYSSSEINKKKSYSYNKFLSIDQILNTIVTRTKVNVDNPIVDFKPLEIAEIYIPEFIPDGKKFITYYSMIQQLVYLNPELNPHYIISLIFYINNNYAKPKMEIHKLRSLFEYVYSSIKNDGISKPKTFIKFVHFNPDKKLSGKEKNMIANKLNGLHKQSRSINLIRDAKKELSLTNTIITQKQVSNHTGLSLKTVQTHFNSEPINMEEEVKKINDLKYLENEPIASTTGNRFKSISRNREAQSLLKEFIHPTCPKWALDF